MYNPTRNKQGRCRVWICGTVNIKECCCVKKLFLILTAVILLFSSAVLAEDLSALTDEELLALYQNVETEIGRRGNSANQKTEFEAAAVRDRVTTFFTWWSVNNLDEMLKMCSSGWKASAADPRTELFKILLNRTPLDLEIESAAPIAGESPDGFSYYYVTATSRLDRNNGTAPKQYRIRLLVRKEEDGLWYIDPTGLNDCENAEEEFPAEATATPESSAGTETAETVLYYQPSGGEYYHADRNCKRVNPTFLPLQGSFLYSELNNEPYRNLKPCEICGAPPAPEADPFHFETFGEVLDATDGGYTMCNEYADALIQQDGRYFRAVSFLDEQAKELYAAYTRAWETESEKDVSKKGMALDAYIDTLPVQYTEELTVVPFSPTELDAMTGITLEQAMAGPWNLNMINYPEDAEAGKDVVFRMVKGFCNYDLVINEPYEVYTERRDADRYDPVTIMSLQNYLDLTVKYVRYTGPSHNTLDLNYLADGTRTWDTEPFTEGYDYDLMVEIADQLAAVWENGEPDQETKEAMIVKLTEEHPKAADMIREIVESFH